MPCSFFKKACLLSRVSKAARHWSYSGFNDSGRIYYKNPKKRLKQVFWAPDHSTQGMALEVSSLTVWLWACPDKCPMIYLTLTSGAMALPQRERNAANVWSTGLRFPGHFGTCEDKWLPGCDGLAPDKGDSQQGATAALVSFAQQHLVRSPRKTPALVIHESAVTIPPRIHPIHIACSQMFLAGNCFKMCPCCGQDWASWHCM